MTEAGEELPDLRGELSRGVAARACGERWAAHGYGAGVVAINLAEGEFILFTWDVLEECFPGQTEFASEGPVGLEPVDEFHCGNFPVLVLVKSLEVHNDI